MTLNISWISDSKLIEWLDEDSYPIDITTFALGIKGKTRARIIAREECMVACSEEASRIYLLAGAEKIAYMLETGKTASKGSLALEVIGEAYALHRAWRVAQTILSVCSGITTRTNKLIKKIRKYSEKTILATTRKTIPGLRALFLKAVIAGGGLPHRLGLFDSILVFPNHTRLLDSKDFKHIIRIAREAFPEKPVTIEVKSFDEAVKAIQAGANAVQLDKFPPDAVKKVIRFALKDKTNMRIIVTGNISEDNIEEYAKIKPDTIVTSAPYYGRPVDMETIIEPLNNR